MKSFKNCCLGLVYFILFIVLACATGQCGYTPIQTVVKINDAVYKICVGPECK